MKRINNKGFAFSTLLYGLLLVTFLTVSLMMSFMQVNRKNTTKLVKSINEELSRFGNVNADIINSTETQNFQVPYGQGGWYRIEAWAAAVSQEHNGAYTSGYIYLEEGRRIYINIGNETSPTTDIRLVGGDRNDPTSQKSTIMRAGAGTTYGFYASGSQSTASYIYGYAGASQVLADPVVGGKTVTTGTPDNKYFVYGQIVPYANAGNVGKVKIRKMGTEEDITGPTLFANSPINNVISIKACAQNGSSTLPTIYAMKEGKNVSQRSTQTSSPCVTYNYQTTNFDEIAATITSNSDLVEKLTITTTTNSTTYINTTNTNNLNGRTGIRLSKKVSFSETQPNDNAGKAYYIQSATQPDKFLSAGSSLSLTNLSDSKNNIWVLENASSGGYNITNTGVQKKIYIRRINLRLVNKTQTTPSIIISQYNTSASETTTYYQIHTSTNTYLKASEDGASVTNKVDENTLFKLILIE